MTYLPQSKIKEFRERNKPLCCPILASKKDDWVLDHDHQTGMVRGVISRQANSLLGKVENFYLRMCKGDKEQLPGVLDAMAAYLEQETLDVLHPVGLIQLTKRFKNSLTAAEQVVELRVLGATKKELESCSNEKDRCKLYRELTKKYYEHTTENTVGAQGS
jgi:hypothetical protein|tara:strand:+ start:1676 stop:2158 length:483 start_codon:yes stop_codon:yes gene_type:complete